MYLTLFAALLQQVKSFWKIHKKRPVAHKVAGLFISVIS